ncbi:FG-GAP-like repeat-containing protein [Lysobacter sp. Hz 25]|uniref:FG-GAP-like repeat-containing protein n=1 Tax=Lysobacter sp. Hz 25 TaxID=3383698 RepID=UPI0038D50859
MRTFGLFVVAALCAAFSCVASAAIITSIAGGGSGGNYASQTATYPYAVAIAPNGEIYVAGLSRIHKIMPEGVMRVVAGTGTGSMYGGDGGPATEARLYDASAIALDGLGNIYFSDTQNQRVRRIGADGIIRTVAGTGVAGPASDGVATQSTLNSPNGLAIGPDGALYISDSENHCIRRLGADGRLVTVAGDGTAGFSGDGASAAQARLNRPRGLAFDAVGALYLADQGNQRIRRVRSDGKIETVIGGGSDAQSAEPLSTKIWANAVAIGPDGSIAFTDGVRVRLLKDGAITLVAGSQEPYGFNGDGGEATQARFGALHGIAFDKDGNLYVVDASGYSPGYERVRKIALANQGLPAARASRFQPAIVIPIVGYGEGVRVAIGDVTGDGRNDVVASLASYGTDPNTAFKIMIFAGQANGGFEPAQIGSYYYKDTGLQRAADLVLSDMNNDGIQDVLIGDGAGVVLFLANRERKLVGVRYPVPRAGVSGSIAVLDIDLDGKPEVAHYLDNNGVGGGGYPLQIFKGLGQGGLGAPYGIASAPEYGLVAKSRDMNGDGYQDLVVASRGSGAYLYQHDGIGGFLKPRLLGDQITRTLGDLDSDKRVDLVESADDMNMTARYANGKFVRIGTSSSAHRPYAADIDGDHRDDLLLPQNQYLAVYDQTDLGLADPTLYPMYLAVDVAVGEIGGDACKDAVVITRFNGLQVLHGRDCLKGAPSDVDGNGKSDLLWRDDARQHLAIWTMDGASRLNGVGHAVPPEWRVLATGDFQGDRKLDVLWTNGAQMQLWEGAGDGQFRGVAMRDYPVGWRVVATGDVDGDGNADLLWRDDANTAISLWVMKGAQIIDSAAYATSRDWWVAGSGDLTGDGRLDVIWTNGASMQLWKGTDRLRFTGETMPDYPQGWEPTATGDVTGDGKADLMWRHPELGHFAVWAMAGGARLYGIGYQPGPSWRVAQTGDFTGDGRTDIVWTDGSLMQLWQSHGSGFTGFTMPNYPLGWSVIRR